MSHNLFHILVVSLWQTVYMVMVSGLIATVFGLPIGVSLFVMRPGQVLECKSAYRVVSAVVNALRSIPFIILLVALIPFTRFIVGSSIGTTAAIVPLTIGAIPFISRLFEAAFLKVPFGLIEAGIAMGASPMQLVQRILIPEAMPGLIQAVTVTLVTLVGYSAMAGVVGGGGLGDLAIRYGYQRFEWHIMLITIVVLIAFVQLIQWVGDLISRALTRG